MVLTFILSLLCLSACRYSGTADKVQHMRQRGGQMGFYAAPWGITERPHATVCFAGRCWFLSWDNSWPLRNMCAIMKISNFHTHFGGIAFRWTAQDPIDDRPTLV